MKSNDERKLFEASGHLDDGIVADVLARYTGASKAARHVKTNKFFKIAVSLAACLLLLVCAIPLLKNAAPEPPVVIESVENTVIVPAADHTSEEVNTAPVYDGSRGLIYEVNEDGKSASLVSFNGCDDEVMVIASHYNGLPVTIMKNQPFYDLEYVPVNHGYSNSKVKRIVISDTVEEIWWGVLEEMPNLESIYIGASVRKLTLAFDGGFNFKLSSFEVSPENKTFTAKNNCLIEIETKTLVKGCLTSVIPDDGSVEIIGRDAFSLFPIESMIIPEGIKEIEHSAFQYCSKLKSITLPKSLEVMASNAFHHCDGLVSFDLNGFTYLPAFALSEAWSLTEIKGTENLTSIGKYALSSCKSLKSIELGVCLEEIGQNAFADYRSSLDRSLVINYLGTSEQWAAVEKHEDWKIRSDSITIRCAG